MKAYRNRPPDRFGVVSSVKGSAEVAIVGIGSPMQLSFPFIEPVGLLGVVDMGSVSQRAFVQFLKHHRPRFVFDIRPVPSFDIGQLSRRSAFKLFEDEKITYRDIAGALEVNALKNVALEAERLAKEIASAIDNAAGPTRRLALLTDGSHGGRWAKMQLAATLGRASWVVMELG